MSNLTEYQKNYLKFSEELFQIGKKMRIAQKGYFKTRDSQVLKEAKKLEKEFDRIIRDMSMSQDIAAFNNGSHQSKLFE